MYKMPKKPIKQGYKIYGIADQDIYTISIRALRRKGYRIYSSTLRLPLLAVLYAVLRFRSPNGI